MTTDAPSGPPPGSPEAMPEHPNPYRNIGLLLLFTPLVFGFVLYAAVATVVGESRIEDTWWSSVLLFAPNVLGGLLLAFGSRLPMPSSGRQAGSLAAVGVVLVGLGIYGTFSADPGDANIGAAIMVAAGLIVIGVGVFAARRGR